MKKKMITHNSSKTVNLTKLKSSNLYLHSNNQLPSNLRYPLFKYHFRKNNNKLINLLPLLQLDNRPRVTR